MGNTNKRASRRTLDETTCQERACQCQVSRKQIEKLRLGLRCDQASSGHLGAMTKVVVVLPMEMMAS